MAGFLLRLATLDTSGQRVLGRLLDAATRAGRRARAEAGDHLVVRIDEAWPAAPAQPWGHPDCVLARAVAAGVLDRTEARLIGATRLEDITVADAAAGLDIEHTWPWPGAGSPGPGGPGDTPRLPPSSRFSRVAPATVAP